MPPTIRCTGIRRALLPRLLRWLLRPAAVHFLRRASAGGQEEIERIIGQIRSRWPNTKIILRADSGFCRDELMSWCEQNRVDYLFGLARNARLMRAIGAELRVAAGESRQTGRPARRFKERVYRTRKSWSRPRGVVAKAEQTGEQVQPALRRDLAVEAADGRAHAVRGSLLRPRRDGEPYQGSATRPVCRSTLERDVPRQPAAAVARLGGRRADAGAAPDRPGRDHARLCLRPHHPVEVAEDRRGRHRKRPPRQDRPEFGLSEPGGVPHRLSCPRRRGAPSRPHKTAHLRLQSPNRLPARRRTGVAENRPISSLRRARSACHDRSCYSACRSEKSAGR